MRTIAIEEIAIVMAIAIAIAFRNIVAIAYLAGMVSVYQNH